MLRSFPPTLCSVFICLSSTRSLRETGTHTMWCWRIWSLLLSLDMCASCRWLTTPWLYAWELSSTAANGLVSQKLFTTPMSVWHFDESNWWIAKRYTISVLLLDGLMSYSIPVGHQMIHRGLDVYLNDSVYDGASAEKWGHSTHVTWIKVLSYHS